MPVMLFLVDVSAWIRYPVPQVGARLDELAASGLLVTCRLVELRLLSGPQDAEAYAMVAKLRRYAYPALDTSDVDVQRALEVQACLADTGQLSVPWPALLVAAVAERHQVTVLHAACCFDLIARATDQAVEWVDRSVTGSG
jgi:predicted nucleic acid-binding protein